MIDIYALKCPAVMEKESFNRFLQALPEEKRERVNRFRNPADSYRALLADVLVRSLICEVYEISNDEIEYDYNAYGKPFLKSFPNFCFNVSHSGEWVVCATHDAQVGIDVEQICPIDLDIATHYFATAEVEDLLAKHPDEQVSYFYDLWTLKESYIKARGMGLSIPLQSFAIRKNLDQSITISQSDSRDAWAFHQYEIDPGYKLSACATANQFAAQVVMRDLQDLDQAIFHRKMSR
ncbi:4'-phosphopantetheinyl transferase superfamily protein [Brevibacillus brevis]|uniref:4'-phosphopantetheinyl transferase family protein n=1 Tax=Brevibacillus brevis TaxID=1393 RepID=UPI001C8E69DD|nr:4'-phosphopantetheinyl transferase superfamily protein [Brevibacillus brevis]MBY0084104.1 4'-phosphopantetheinyl transferase superfamily protein [Brevibacillus brevis]